MDASGEVISTTELETVLPNVHRGAPPYQFKINAWSSLAPAPSQLLSNLELRTRRSSTSLISFSYVESHKRQQSDAPLTHRSHATN